MRFLILLVITFWSILTNAQDLHYVKSTIDVLTNEGMHGRGYVNEGHKIAANYIASEFEQFGLQSFRKDYLQQFVINVNTFPGKMSLKLGKQKLTPGEDFLVHPSSPGINGSYKTLHLQIDSLLANTTDWVKRIKNAQEVIVLDNFGYNDLSGEDKQVIDGLKEVLQFNKELLTPAVVILTDEKLTWGTSQVVGVRPIFQVRKSVVSNSGWTKAKFNVQNDWLKEETSQNVIGLIPGVRSDSVIMIIAHYDHLGRMGNRTYFPGANDNASGTAMMLNLARELPLGDKPKFGILFVAFSGEEAGLVGSQYYVNRPVYPLNRVKFLINLDLVGTGDDGITVVNGSVHKKQFELLKKINNEKGLLPQIKSRGEACNSDHCPFHNQGVPGFFIYTLGGIQAYHDIYDRSETLPLTEFEDLTTLIKEFIKSIN